MIHTYISELAAKSPLLLYKNKAYIVTTTPSSLSLSLDGVTYGLIPAGSNDSLLKYYAHLNADSLMKEKKNFITEKLKTSFRDEKQREKDVGDKKLFKFIVEDLLPYMSGHKEDLSELMDGAIDIREKKVNAAYLKKVSENELMQEFVKTKKRLVDDHIDNGKKLFNGCIGNCNEYLNQVTGGGNILIFGNEVYLLKKYENNANSQPSLEIYLDEYKKYSISKSNSTSQLDADLNKFLFWQADLSAIDEFSAYIQDMEKIRLSSKKDLDKIMLLDDFNDGDVGFLNKGGHTYIYQLTGAFAMLDPRPKLNDICYEFPSLKVALQISWSDNKPYLSEPVLVDPVWHPFTENNNKSFQHLCGGRVPSNNYKSYIEWVAKALDDAKNLVMNGLTPHSIKGHGGGEGNGGNYFGTPLDQKLSPYKIKLADAKKKGLLITNYWKWESG